MPTAAEEEEVEEEVEEEGREEEEVVEAIVGVFMCGDDSLSAAALSGTDAVTWWGG